MTGIDLETLIAPFSPLAFAMVKPVGAPSSFRPSNERVFELEVISILWALVARESAFGAGAASSVGATSTWALSEALADGAADFVAAGESWVVAEEMIEVTLSWPVTELKPRKATRTISNERAT